MRGFFLFALLRVRMTAVYTFIKQRGQAVWPALFT